MKLNDFTYHGMLNELRSKMNAPLIVWEVSRWSELDQDELRQRLNSIEGIEVEIDEIVSAKDGTFEYKGQKVLVYIRDQYSNPKYPNREYKFHIANCDTMEKAFAKGRSDRYVVSTRTDGRFLVNVREPYTRKVIKSNAIEELHVCKNCLLRIHYNGYQSHYSGKRIYSEFKLSDYFERFISTQHRRMPRYTDLSAPPDEYSQEFDKLSRALRENNGWRCKECGRDFSEYRELLHTHHKNGVKGDNSLENLMTVCVYCHSEYPEHGHLKNSSGYTRYLELFGG